MAIIEGVMIKGKNNKKGRKNIFSLFRHHTTKKAHNHLASKINWYDVWHKRRYHKHIHVSVLLMYVLSVSFGLFNLPQTAEAALNQTTKTITAQEDFESGEYSDDIVVENGSIKLKSMSSLSNSDGGAWLYRKLLTLDNSGGEEVADYQFKFSFDSQSLVSAGKMQSDGDDIRFTDTDGETELEYWLDSGINTSETVVWVKVPLVLADSSKEVYFYYANPSATSSSNASIYSAEEVSFYVHNSSHKTSVGTVIWDVVTDNTGDSYNPTNGKFTASQAGIYHFSWGGIEYPKATLSRTVLYVNGVRYASNAADVRHDGSTYYDASTRQASIHLDSGDEVTIYLSQGGIYQAYNHFSGHLVSADESTPSFYAYNSSHVSSVGSDIAWNVVKSNTGDHYNSTNGRFIAPTDGVYYFSWGGISRSAGVRSRFRLFVNGSSYAYPADTVYSHSYPSRYDDASRQATIVLSAGDRVTVNLLETGIYANHGYFTGHRISEDTSSSSFYARTSGHYTSQNSYVKYANVSHNTGSDFSASSGKFTAPEDGVYNFSWGGIEYPASTVGRTYLYLNGNKVSGSNASQLRYDNTTARYDGASNEASLKLSAGDEIGVYLTAGGTYNAYSYFTGYLADCAPASINYSVSGELGASVPTGSWQSDNSTEDSAIDLVWNGGWGAPNGFEADVDLSADSSVEFQARTSDVGGEFDDDWSSWQSLGTISSSGGTGSRTFEVTGANMPEAGSLPIGTNRYVQIRVVMNATATSPSVDEFRLMYLADYNSPSNPTVVDAYSNDSKSESYPDDSWQSSLAPYFEWSGAEDGLDESGIEGYWVYFGSDVTADPVTAGEWQIGSSFTADIDDDDSGKTFYLSIKTEDSAGNRYSNGEPDYYKEFTYKLDATKPDSPVYVGVSPVGWATVNSFDFSWPSAGDIMVNGDSSGLAGYQYKMGESGEWSAIIQDTFVNDLEAYQNGQNIFYVRSVDNAGNYSNNVVVNFFYNADAPEEPLSLSVSPPNSTTNSFTFSWDEPANPNTPIKGYYYSVNAVPTASNSVYVTEKTVENIAAATQQGLNTFYVVAMDSTDNVNFSNYAEIQFQCNTPAPGIPVSIEAFDTSNRDLQKYSIALNWEEPEYTGVGFAGYEVERSEDGVEFEVIGSSTATSYIDVNLESKTYFYRVVSKDDSSNHSAPSSVVSLVPTGRYTSPPELTHGPEIEYKISTATIRWFTDREASSFVEIGENVNYGLTQGQFDFTTDHVVDLENLSADTVYHYRVKYVDQDGNIGYSPDATFKTEPAPRVRNVEVSDIRLNTAYLSWTTTAPAECDVVIGKSANYSSSINNISGGFTKSHAILLTDLDHSSSYNFAVRLTDIDGNEFLSDNYTFETLKYPKISLIRVEPVKDAVSATMKFTWETNVPTTSIVQYSPSGGVTQEKASSKLATKHEVQISELIDNTDYSVRVMGRDQFGNLAEGDTQRFKTDYDTRPPKVFDVDTEMSIDGFGTDAKGRVVFSWESDELSTSQIEYGVGSGGGYTSKSKEDMSLTKNHVVILGDLKTSSPYHFRVISRDGAGNVGKSEDNALITGQASSSIIDIVFSTLESTLGWVFQNDLF